MGEVAVGLPGVVVALPVVAAAVVPRRGRFPFALWLGQYVGDRLFGRSGVAVVVVYRLVVAAVVVAVYVL